MSIVTPNICPKGRTDCSALACVQSDVGLAEGGSLVCCGHNTPENRSWAADVFRVCWKSEKVDEMGDYDHADMKDTISVLAQALSADEHITRNNKEDGEILSSCNGAEN